MYCVRLTRIPEDGLLTEKDARLGLSELGLGEPFDSDGVSLSWDLSRMMGKVYGKVRAVFGMRLECRRCLEGFSRGDHVDFAVLFEPRPRGGSGRKDSSKESDGDVDDDDADAGPSVVYFDGEDLPLGEEVRQELESAVPFSPLCRDDCQGLCARCGARLNLGPCGCKEVEGDSWSPTGLKQVRPDSPDQ